MLYLLAIIGVVVVAVLLWRSFGTEGTGTSTQKAAPVPPDDDPDFLRKLSEEQRRKRRNEEEN